MAVESGASDENVVEGLAAQRCEHSEASCENAERRLARPAMLELRIRMHDVDVRVVVQHLGVVRVDQGRDMGVSVTSAQCGDQRRGANQVADIVPADDEDSHVRALFVLSLLAAPQARSTPTVPQNRRAFWRANSMSVMFRVSIPTTTATSAIPHAAAASDASAAKCKASRTIAASRSKKRARPGTPTCKAVS